MMVNTIRSTLGFNACMKRELAFLLLLCAFLGSVPYAQCAARQSDKPYSFIDVAVVEGGRTGFSLLGTSQTGVEFTNHLSAFSVGKNRILDNGSGVALGDVDGDGWCDIYFCRLEGSNVLYRNLGNWRFEDVTSGARVGCAGDLSSGAVLADLDGDDDLDLLVNSIGGGTRCFINDGTGQFEESTESGLLRKFGATSMALADIDGDGDLDLYVANYRTTNFKDAPPGVKVEFYRKNGNIIAAPEERFFAFMKGSAGIQFFERGEEDFLYLNNGKGGFSNVPWTEGAFVDADGNSLSEPLRYWGLSAMFRDIDGDTAPDLHVCNDFAFSYDSVWLNNGQGAFRAMPRLALREMSMSSMGADFADINRDGHVDFFVADMLSRDYQRRQIQRANVHPDLMTRPMGVIEDRPEVMRNTLFLNRGDATFAEIARFSGVEASEWAWCPIFLDVDLDGYEDLLVTTGNGHDVLDSDANARLETLNRNNPPGEKIRALDHMPALPARNIAFRNRGDLTFEEVGSLWGFNADGVSHGMALGDLDNDGDLDLVVNNLNAAAGLYRNETATPRIGVRLKGIPPNTRGIGAKIEVFGGPVSQSQEMICGGRYLSGDDSMRVFAAGNSNNALTIKVRWRSGKVRVVHEARPNRIYEIDETGASEQYPTSRVVRGGTPAEGGGIQNPDLASPYFEDVSHLIAHRHVEEAYDDFVRQPLLPFRLSRLGPGVGWHDFDSDGWDDLIVGSGRGGIPGVYRNKGSGTFAPYTDVPVNRLAPRDQTSVLGLGSSLLFGAANYEDGLRQGGRIRIYDLDRKVAGDSIMGPTSSTGPLAMADVDGDGDLDLFIGGRVVAGRYPEPADSLLMRNENGRFMPAQTWEKLGLVSGAVFSDLNEDGFSDLVLACEWGPVRVFLNRNGVLSERTRELGFNRYQGWWNGVTTGDFDGDGRMDIVASNWGRNTEYERHRSEGLRVYYGDLDANGTVDVVEAFRDGASGGIVPRRGFEILRAAIPIVGERFDSFRSFAASSVSEVFRDELKLANELRAGWLDSTVFLNRNGRFEARSLPAEAQLAPAFGVSVGDFDGDGNEDIFLAQNFFSSEPEVSRHAAGRGLWLRGNGKGEFNAVPGQVSGVLVHGEQRGCALGDYDGDGRVDLVVGQNANQTKLFRNVSGRQGLRVRLKGQAGNLSAGGAMIRLIDGDTMGPAREIHVGGGYWSQESPIPVMSLSGEGSGIWVRWPGGKVTTSALSGSEREIEIRSSGGVRVLK